MTELKDLSGTYIRTTGMHPARGVLSKAPVCLPHPGVYYANAFQEGSREAGTPLGKKRPGFSTAVRPSAKVELFV